jgi:hypothetical protein
MNNRREKSVLLEKLETCRQRCQVSEGQKDASDKQLDYLAYLLLNVPGETHENEFLDEFFDTEVVLTLGACSGFIGTLVDLKKEREGALQVADEKARDAELDAEMSQDSSESKPVPF